jgi:hypothetical protein
MESQEARNVRRVRSGLSIESQNLIVVQKRAPLHLLPRQSRIGERVRSRGHDQCRGGASNVPSDLGQRVHVLQNAREHPHLQEFLLERADVVERDGGRAQDGVERRDLLADEMVLCFCVQRGLVRLEVVVPPPFAFEVLRSRRDGDVGRCVDDGGHNGGGKGEACSGRVEVEDGGLALCVGVRWWLGRIVDGNDWGLRAICVIFDDSRVWSMSGCHGFTGDGFGYPRL